MEPLIPGKQVHHEREAEYIQKPENELRIVSKWFSYATTQLSPITLIALGLAILLIIASILILIASAATCGFWEICDTWEKWEKLAYPSILTTVGVAVGSSINTHRPENS